MIASEILSKGVEQGIITAEQAEGLRALERAREPLELPPSPDDEQLRFISGFSDIFVTIGLAMFLGAIGYFAQQSGGKLGMWIAIAITAWLLAEFFTRRRRMALPSIVLLIVFAFAVFMDASTLLGAGLVRPTSYFAPSLTANLLGLDREQPTMLAAAAFLTVLLTAVHYWRFRVPITIAAGCGALSVTVVALVYGMAPQLSSVAHNAVILASGLAIFALAMRFDMLGSAATDTANRHRLLASSSCRTLIVHSLIRELMANTSKLDPDRGSRHHGRLSGVELCRRSDRPPRNAGVRPVLRRNMLSDADSRSRLLRYDHASNDADTWRVRVAAQRRLASVADGDPGRTPSALTRKLPKTSPQT